MWSMPKFLLILFKNTIVKFASARYAYGSYGFSGLVWWNVVEPCVSYCGQCGFLWTGADMQGPCQIAHAQAMPVPCGFCGGKLA
jgi:hypothetical protein